MPSDTTTAFVWLSWDWDQEDQNLLDDLEHFYPTKQVCYEGKIGGEGR